MHVFYQLNSTYFTIYHTSLPALLPSFLTLTHLSCFLYFSPSRIGSTNYIQFLFYRANPICAFCNNMYVKQMELQYWICEFRP
jgi:hypothetical protein